MKSQAKLFMNNGFNVASLTLPSCDKKLKIGRKLYNANYYEVIEKVLPHLSGDVYIVGNSLGAAIALNFTKSKHYSKSRVKGIVAISAPLDLKDSISKISKGFNKFYSKTLLCSIRGKVKYLQDIFGDFYDVDVDRISSFKEFDEKITAPMFGYKDAEEYWEDASPKNILKDIEIPTLIFSAKNDPLLGEKCYVTQEDIPNENITYEYVEKGGHLGFIGRSIDDYSIADIRALQFIKKISEEN
jgi:predicted alpha/beta-fold hydrolase